jgi:hypothetical protein
MRLPIPESLHIASTSVSDVTRTGMTTTNESWCSLETTIAWFQTERCTIQLQTY